MIQFYPISKCKRGSHQFHFPARTNGPHFYTILSSFVHFDPKLFNFIQFHSAKEAGINSISPYGQTSLTFIQFYPLLSILIQNYPILSNFTVQKRQALIPFPRTGKRASLQPHKYQDDSLGQKLVAFSGRK